MIEPSGILPAKSNRSSARLLFAFMVVPATTVVTLPRLSSGVVSNKVVSAAGLKAIESAFNGQAETIKPDKQAAKRWSCRWANIADDSPPNSISRQTGKETRHGRELAVRQTGCADLIVHRADGLRSVQAGLLEIVRLFIRCKWPLTLRERAD